MTTWMQYLAQQGGHASDGRIADFGSALTVADLARGFVAPITDLGLIAASGDDAASFLHKQLTNDVEHLPIGEARLAGYCSPKGRLLASFLMWRNENTIFLQLPRAIQVALQKRLQMYVLRAKVKLVDVDAGFDAAAPVMLGLGGSGAGAVLKTWFSTLPAAPYTSVEQPMGTLIRVADACGAARYQWLLPAASAQTVWPALAAALALGGNDAWNLAEVHAGVPRIDSATQEQFVPQMVNLELLGGVNFKKGCYPGQEIVARSQYLGKLKRRTTLVGIADPAARAGDELYAQDDPGQPCGMIVQSAPNGAGGVDALAEMTLSAIEQGGAGDGAIRLGSSSGAALHLLVMPYALDPLDL